MEYILYFLILVLLYLFWNNTNENETYFNLEEPMYTKESIPNDAPIKYELGVDEYLRPGEKLNSPNNEYSLVLTRHQLYVQNNITSEKYIYINSNYDVMLPRFGIDSDGDAVVIELRNNFYVTFDIIYRNGDEPPTSIRLSNGGNIMVYRYGKLVYMMDIIANIKGTYN